MYNKQNVYHSPALSQPYSTSFRRSVVAYVLRFLRTLTVCHFRFWNRLRRYRTGCRHRISCSRCRPSQSSGSFGWCCRKPRPRLPVLGSRRRPLPTIWRSVTARQSSKQGLISLKQWSWPRRDKDLVNRNFILLFIPLEPSFLNFVIWLTGMRKVIWIPTVGSC